MIYAICLYRYEGSSPTCGRTFIPKMQAPKQTGVGRKHTAYLRQVWRNPFVFLLHRHHLYYRANGKHVALVSRPFL